MNGQIDKLIHSQIDLILPVDHSWAAGWALHPVTALKQLNKTLLSFFQIHGLSSQGTVKVSKSSFDVITKGDIWILLTVCLNMMTKGQDIVEQIDKLVQGDVII